HVSIDERWPQQLVGERAAQFRNPRVQLEPRALQQCLACQREAVGVKSAGTDSYQEVAGPNRARVRNPAPLDQTYGEARQVIFAWTIEVAGLARLTPNQTRPRHSASARPTSNDVANKFSVKLHQPDIVHED